MYRLISSFHLPPVSRVQWRWYRPLCSKPGTSCRRRRPAALPSKNRYHRSHSHTHWQCTHSNTVADSISIPVLHSIADLAILSLIPRSGIGLVSIPSNPFVQCLSPDTGVRRFGNEVNTMTYVAVPCRNCHCIFRSHCCVKVPYRWTSVKGGAHMCFVDAWISSDLRNTYELLPYRKFSDMVLRRQQCYQNTWQNDLRFLHETATYIFA